MFIGHFAVAYILMFLAPGVPPIVALVGVSFPDLLWPVLVLAGIEKVGIDPGSPLQDAIVFTRYPYSHSLVIGTLIAAIPGILIGIAFGAAAGVVFVVASASHWLLDTIVHKKDLPILGFGKDRTFGLGLWNRGPFAFVVELIFYVVVTLLVVPEGYVIPLLVIGFLFHMINANSFFRFSAKNPFGSPRIYAAAALVGFISFILLAEAVFAGIL